MSHKKTNMKYNEQKTKIRKRILNPKTQKLILTKQNMNRQSKYQINTQKGILKTKVCI